MPQWFALLAFLLFCENADGLTYKIIHPKTLDVVGSDIFLLVRAECSKEEDKNSGKRLCISINNATEKHNVRSRSLFSHCMQSPRLQCSNAKGDEKEGTMVHLHLNVGNTRGVLSLLLTGDVLITASNPRTDPFVYDTVIIQTKPSVQENHIIALPGTKQVALALLSPLDKMNVQHGRPVEVVFYHHNPSPSTAVCVQVDDGLFKKCFLSNSRQPLNLYGVPVGIHVLKIWDDQLMNPANFSDRGNNLDFVPTSIFRVQKRSKLPAVRIASPLPDDVLGTQNVWIKLGVGGGWTANDIGLGEFLVCFRLLPSNLFTCKKRIEEPFHLTGLKRGEYELHAWVATSKEEEVPNTTVSVNFAVTGSVKRSDRTGSHEAVPAPAQECSTNSTFILFIFAYERLDHLRKLWKSVKGAHYFDCSVDVKIFVDKSPVADVHDRLVRTANSFSWEHGEIAVILREERVGLVENILSAWEAPLANERAIFLEDDVVVSPWYFYYLLAVERRGVRPRDTQLKPRFLGVSLYRPDWNEIEWHPVVDNPSEASDNGDHVALMQLPCSWGGMFYPGPWSRFLEWQQAMGFLDQLGAGVQATGNDRFWLPDSMSNFWRKSWKRPLLRFMVETNLYMTYPSRSSFSTTSSPPGENIEGDTLSALYNVSIIFDFDKNLRDLGEGDTPLNAKARDMYSRDRAPKRISCAASVVKVSVRPEDGAAAAPLATCAEKGDGTVCEFRHVAITSNGEIKIFNSLAGQRRLFGGPLLAPNFRHRCCMDSQPLVSAKVLPGTYDSSVSSYCDARVEKAYLFSLTMFPQHGHTFHDTLFSLFVTLVERGDFANGEDERTGLHFILANNNDEALETVDDLGPYKIVLETLLSGRGKIWLLSDFTRSNRVTCVDSLVSGLSSSASFYANFSSAMLVRTRQLRMREFIGIYETALQVRRTAKASVARSCADNSFCYSSERLLFVHRTSRKVLNRLELYNATVARGYDSSTVSFENLSLREQVESVQGISVLVGVLGTGLFNSLFMKSASKVVILMPFGVKSWMGENVIRMASLENREVVRLESKKPRRNTYLRWTDFVGPGKPFSPTDVYSSPDKVWLFDWMVGFSLFMNQDFYIDKDEFVDSL